MPLHDRIGGEEVLARVVDELYDRLVTDPRVLHHFEPARLPSLKAAQRTWLAHVLGGDTGQRPLPDLTRAHRHLVISDEQVDAVVGHLDEAIAAEGVDPEVRRQVLALVRRLWHAREF